MEQLDPNGRVQDAAGETPTPTTTVNETDTESTSLKKENKDLPQKLVKAKEYVVWALRMKLHFEALDLWGVVQGTEVPPGEDAEASVKQKYKKRKARAHSDLLRCIGDNFQALAATYDNPKDLWLALKELFQPADNTQLLAAQLRIEALETTYPFTS